MRARAVAFYLPQYHPVEVNDKYWGKGFTEWRNVAKAKPLFRGHYEPRIPADLGYYDLRLPEIREEQADLAKEAGIEGFCYWHYWFGNGIEVLEKPFDVVVESGSPNYPFCLGWANHSWTTKTWTATKSKAESAFIFEQKYPGKEDYINHFYRLLSAFKDKRYMTIEGRLVFIIFDLDSFTDFKTFKTTWNQLAVENGLKGFYFIAHTSTVAEIGPRDISRTKKSLLQLSNDRIDAALEKGVDGVETLNMKYAELLSRGILYKIAAGISRKYLNGIYVEKYDYKKILEHYYTERNRDINVFPEILVGNDRSPRAGKKAIVYKDANPEAFYQGAKNAIDLVQHKDYEHRLVFVNSWNEWGEGSYMEPDLRYGKDFIYALKRALEDNQP